MVWRTIRRLVRHEADANDCFQRTFVSALEVSRSHDVRSWAALLRRLATFRAIECIRQRRRAAARLTILPDQGTVDDRALQPIDVAGAGELADRLRDALADLDELPAKVFCLACLDGFSYQEIAEQLGLTVNHVGVLLTRARGVLRERLEAFVPAADPGNLERK